MKIKIEINANGSAFYDEEGQYDPSLEVRRILTDLVNRWAEQYPDLISHPLFDTRFGHPAGIVTILHRTPKRKAEK